MKIRESDPRSISDFVTRWAASEGAERANKDLFLSELCDLLDVPRPDPTTGDPDRDAYVFEKDVRRADADGTPQSVGRIDLYRKGAFVLEAKQGSTKEGRRMGTARRGTAGWAVAMQDAYGQALSYARLLDDPPPFLIVVDVGHCVELFSCFDGSRSWRPFPDAARCRFELAELEAKRDLLRAVWEDPLSLDPSKQSAKVTREVAAHLAELARRLEAAGHPPDRSAQFLMRCLFTMFAEDVGLLPRELFTDALATRWRENPASFPAEISALWATMNSGGSLFGVGKIRRFNGGLFSETDALPLDRAALDVLREAASCQWSDVEPAIFGTLLERALDPKERHALGAHYTPRAYVERLVRPTIEEPLRADWDAAKDEAAGLVEAGKEKEAREAVRRFHRKLCKVRVLDPACGTGNFLYVTLELLKRLEAEVLTFLADLGDRQTLIEMETISVMPEQLLGIEKKRWAKEIAELVLWIGWLDGQRKLRGNLDGLPEPILQHGSQIEERDAVLAWDRIEPVLDEDGKPVTRWDGETTKPSPVTGEPIPDESAKVPVVCYVSPRKAEWPEADFVVGNPPYVGNKRMRLTLGDGYVEALRGAHPDVPETADLVMYWWNAAADKVRTGEIRRFGLITTNSITQTFNRKTVQRHLDADPPMHIAFAIPDHPWVDSADGAAVRVAMTVGAPERKRGEVSLVVSEEVGDTRETPVVRYSKAEGTLDASLTAGTSLSKVSDLQANTGLSFMGVIPVGLGFRLESPDVARLRLSPKRFPPVVRRYKNGRDLVDGSPDRLIIDFHGWNLADASREYPALVQVLLEKVKPERENCQRRPHRERWWVFGESRGEMREALSAIPRYVVTVETAKHRWFAFLDSAVLPDQKLRVVASDDSFVMAALSARPHVVFAAAAGGRMGVGNDLVYNGTRCFNPFPFPAATKLQKARIRALGEQLDAHRKARQAEHPDLTITEMYNVLEKLRSGEALSPKERKIHDDGLVSVLRQIHDDLDVAVFDAYGWPKSLTDEEILERLVALNAERAEEEKRGLIRWLRPEYQNPSGSSPAVQGTLPRASDEGEEGDAPTKPTRRARGSKTKEPKDPARGEGEGSASRPRTTKKPAAAERTKSQKPVRWPTGLPKQLAAVRRVLDTDRTPRTADELASRFLEVERAQLVPVLEALLSLGLATKDGLGRGVRWRSASRKPA